MIDVMARRISVMVVVRRRHCWAVGLQWGKYRWLDESLARFHIVRPGNLVRMAWAAEIEGDSGFCWMVKQRRFDGFVLAVVERRDKRRSLGFHWYFRWVFCAGFLWGK